MILYGYQLCGVHEVVHTVCVVADHFCLEIRLHAPRRSMGYTVGSPLLNCGVSVAFYKCILQSSSLVPLQSNSWLVVLA